MIRAGEIPAPYLRWAKERPGARFDLVLSNVLAPAPDELPDLFEGVSHSGANADGLPALVDAVAAMHATTPSHVALGGGASGANFLALAALAGPGDEVLVEWPGYDPMAGSARLAGAKVSTFARLRSDRWAVDPDRVAALLTPSTRVVAVTSPHNPTGVIIPPETLERLAERCAANDTWLLVDEAYRGGADAMPPSVAGLHPRLVVTGSLTKFHGLHGLRAGWVVGIPEVAARVLRTRDVVDGSGAFATEMAAARAMARRGALEARSRRILLENRDRLAARVAATPSLGWVPPDGGTIALLELVGVDDELPFCERLLGEDGVAVAPGSYFGVPGSVRIAFGGDPTMFAEALDRFVAAAGGTPAGGRSDRA